MKIHKISVLLVIILSINFSESLAVKQVSGIVYHDRNGNGLFDVNEPGISGVMISNGTDITHTDEQGRYEIEADDNSIVFMIKPGGWQTPVNENNIPQFFSIISSVGASGSDFDGLLPVNPDTDNINFALTPYEESENMRVLVFGDTQPRTIEEVNYIAHDSVQEVIGADAAFGTTLGDLVFDDLNLFEPLNQVIAQIGIPWRHVMGNHDIDFSADTNWDARGTYMNTYGPSWYAFTHGNTHFVSVDNIRWIVDGEDRYYRTGLGNDQMVFIENFLDKIPDDELVIFFVHIPWVDSTPWADETEKLKLFELIASHPHTATFAAHTHRHYHRFIGEEEGWPGDEPHHMVSMATVCGSWWGSAPDEYGIPHSLMRDGTPTGYGFLDIDDNNWKFTFKAARRPADFQMHISAPDEVSLSQLADTEVYANIFNALPNAEVEMKIGADGEWMIMEETQEPDPVYLAMKAREDALDQITWRRSGDANPNARHLWKTELPENLSPGTYTIFIRAKDEWHHYSGRRIIRIVDL